MAGVRASLAEFMEIVRLVHGIVLARRAGMHGGLARAQRADAGRLAIETRRHASALIRRYAGGGHLRIVSEVPVPATWPYDEWGRLTRFLESDDAETLHASVLLHSYALAESAAADRLAMHWRSLGRIEGWGARLLGSNGRDWSEVKGGLVGAVQVAVVRNAFAHGSRTVDAAARARLLAAGARTKPVGSAVTLTYAELREFRGRLLSLLNLGGIRR